ncbi:MAG: peptidase M16 [Spirochaetia bacterium]|nr:peptidase M16 [Spirochaetia bacterium]
MVKEMADHKELQQTPGDEYFGFILESVDVLDDYHGYGYLYRHRITGMSVYYIANDDKENFFSFIFKTPPQDDCGTAHIIEHSVLAGSKRYPLKDPFMSLLKGSAQTFMNAMTYPDYTAYPAASPVEKDFQNLFKVYADAVFNPLLRENTFRQEGIRTVVDEDGSLHFDGVVFNEMLGELSDHDSIVSRASIRSLYSDTPYFYESGGDPESIILLNYNKFLGYYSTYYHPSNCRLFLYGNQHVLEQLEYLDEMYLSDYSQKMSCPASPIAASWKKSKEIVAYAPTLEDATKKRNASVTLNWATTLVEDPLEVITLTVLTDILLGNPGAPLYKAIIDSKLSKDISQVSGMDTSFRQMPFTVGFKGIDPADADKARDLIFTTLKEIIKEGIDPSLIENALKHQEFLLQEISGSSPMGLRAMSRIVRGWLQDNPPHISLRITDALNRLKEKISTSSRDKEYLFAKKDHPEGLGYFEQWIDTYLLKNPHLCILIVKGEKEYQNKLQRSINLRLEEIKEQAGKDGLELLKKQNEEFDLFEQQKDTPEALATIPRLVKEDVNEPIKTYVQQFFVIDSIPLAIQHMESNGIIYLDGMISLASLSEKQQMLIPILTRMLHMVGYGAFSYSEVAKKVRKHTGGLHFFIETGSSLNQGEEGVIALSFRMKALKREYKAALEVLHLILTQAKVDDVERVYAVIQDITSDFESNVGSSAHMFASQRASSYFSSLLAINEKYNGLDQWEFLKQIDCDDQTKLAEIGNELSILLHTLIESSRIQLHLLCSSDDSEEVKSHTSDFINKIPHLLQQEDSKGFENKVTSDDFIINELYQIPSSVSYSSIVFPSASPAEPLQAHQSLLMYILTTNHLWEMVRGVGGAYGVSGSVDMLERLCSFMSYRDPRIQGTLDDFMKALEIVEKEGIEQDIVDLAIITIISRELRPSYPQSAGMIAFRRSLYHISDAFRETRRNYILETTSLDMKIAASSMLESLKKQKSCVVISGNEVLEKEKNSLFVKENTVITLNL